MKTNKESKIIKQCRVASRAVTPDEAREIVASLLSKAITTQQSIAKQRLLAFIDHHAWRPIAEAPKDGTIVLLRLPDSDVCHSGFWGDAERTLSPIHITWRIAWDHSPTIDPPTHFQPLPEPPAEEKQN